MGRDLLLDGEPHSIIGVLPAGSFDRDDAVFWKPLVFAQEQMNRSQHWLEPIGRLPAGVTLEQAQAKLTMLRASLDGVIYQKDWGFTIDPFARMLVGDTLRRSIYLAFGAGSYGFTHRLRERSKSGTGERDNSTKGDGVEGCFGSQP